MKEFLELEELLFYIGTYIDINILIKCANMTVKKASYNK